MNGEHRTMTSDERRATSGGFTLAEAMLAMVVLGIAAAGVLLPFTSGAKVRAEGIHRTLAAKLASGLMEEILNTPFENIEEIVDEHQEETFPDPLYSNFSRGATCAYAYVPQQSPRDEDQCNYICVTVWVKYNGREIVVINRLISH